MLPVDDNHLTMAKFDSHEHTTYTSVKKEFAQMLQSTTALIPPPADKVSVVTKQLGRLPDALHIAAFVDPYNDLKERSFSFFFHEKTS